MKSRISRRRYFLPIMILIVLIFTLNNCRNNKHYISEKVIDFYKDVTKNPLEDIVVDMNTALQGTNSLDKMRLMQDERNKRVNEFNEKAAKIIRHDPHLEKYFNNLIKKMQNNETITIESLNYYGVAIRKLLEDDLSIDLLD